MLVDETKRAGYVLAAVTVADPTAVRRVVRGLVQPGNRRLHMVDERPRNRPSIVANIVAAEVAVSIYDAARNYPTDREARGACMAALIQDLVAAGGEVRLVIERDETLVSFDNQRIIEAVRNTGGRERLSYEHRQAYEEPLLSLPDVAAWCWVRSGEWRRRIGPVVSVVRNIGP